MSKHPTGDGRWRVRWRDDDGRNRSRTFDRERDADRWDAEIKRLKQLGHLHRLDGGTMTLSQYVNDTVVPEYFSRLAPNTREWYASLLSAHILPELGQIPLRAITAKRLRQWQTRRLKAGAGKYALNRALILLGQILQYACEDGELESNPARLVRKLETDQSDSVVPLAPLTVERIRAHFDGLRDRTIVSLGAYAGLRPAEIWALQRSDIRDRTIHIQRSCDGFGGTKRPKSAKGRRSVRLLEPLAADLKQWLNHPDTPTGAGALVFHAGTPSGVATRDSMGNWREDFWLPALKRAGVAYQRPYDLRHSFASLLLAEGRTVHYVASQLGHDPRLTLSVYGHVMAEFEDAPTIDAAAQITAARRAIDDLPTLTWAATDVVCRRCAAEPGEPCITPSGRVRDSHVDRDRDAKFAATLARFKALENENE